MSKTFINVDPNTGMSITVTALGKDLPDNVFKYIHETELPGKLVECCIKNYCTLDMNNNHIVTKDMVYSKGKTIVTGNNIYIDKSSKDIPIATQYNICISAMANFDGTRARITVYDKVNNTIKVGLQLTDGSCRLATLDRADELFKKFA